MRRRAQADDRLSGIDIIDDVLQLLIGKVAEPREDYHQISGLGASQASSPGIR